MEKTIVLFGEAEKGAFRTPYLCQSLPQLADTLGNPPPESLGLYYGVQALLYHYTLMFFRVREEGFSISDYLQGAQILEEINMGLNIKAICTPGVGDRAILEAFFKLCEAHHQLLITNQADLVDILTSA